MPIRIDKHPSQILAFALLLLVALWLFSRPIPKVYGESITVNATCSLQDAITAANNDSATGGCIAGSAGSDTITITAAGTPITLSSQLVIQGSSSQRSIIVIEGGDFIINGNAIPVSSMCSNTEGSRSTT